MDGIHDLGGMHGFGPVEREEDEPVFHHDWEKRAFGIEFFTGSRIGTTGDKGRHAIERLAPATYLTASYYEKWMLALELLLEEHGVLTRQEIARRMAELVENHDG
ncbi:MAG: nitrile hydratase subunit beta [Proteobacteria bacterium]|nr:nitrile hydratase subunit beta [Pseudomonadota bacterium]MDA1072457.1 nitrile hydratase subunit beta [Pseudomonadota bacterium]